MDHERAGGMSPEDQIARIAECQGNHSGSSVQCRREGFFLEVGDDKVDREGTSRAFTDQGDLFTPPTHWWWPARMQAPSAVSVAPCHRDWICRCEAPCSMYARLVPSPA